MDALRLELRQAIRNVQNSLRTVKTAIKALSDAVTAINAKTQRAGATVGPLSIGSSDTTITWDKPWPDTGYMVIVELVSGTAALGALHATLKVGSKTTTDCVITINATQAVASVGVDVLGVRT